MKNSARTRRWLGWALLVASLARPAAADLEAAKRLYEQAKAEPDPQKQIELLRQSIEAQATFEGYLALGDAQRGLGTQAEARVSLKKALELAGNDRAKARATYVTAETFLAEGDRQEAIALYRQSLRFHPYPNVLDRLKDLELKASDEAVSAEEISAALQSTATRAFYVVSTSIDLRIGFALASSDLDPKGLRQARELGKALAAPALKDKSFEIVGHTDKQGEDAYNDDLSQRRADAVRAFLMREFRVPASRLTGLGMGERELRYPGDTESDHALNRRVEVKVR
jgi:outer membrane protein OmpA-like peptidoglycan-associated protein